MSAEDWIGDFGPEEIDEAYFTTPKPRPRKIQMHRYKILVVISGESGLTSQLLHYVSYEDAETAYTELEKSPTPMGLSVNYIRLYKREERGWKARG